MAHFTMTIPFVALLSCCFAFYLWLWLCNDYYL